MRLRRLDAGKEIGASHSGTIYLLKSSSGNEGLILFL